MGVFQSRIQDLLKYKKTIKLCGLIVNWHYIIKSYSLIAFPKFIKAKDLTLSIYIYKVGTWGGDVPSPFLIFVYSLLSNK